MKCPGQDSRYWGADAVKDAECPACGAVVEFFKDESKGRCPACGFRFRNPGLDLGCAEWCPHASACVGTLDRADGPGHSVVDQLILHVKALPEVPEETRQRGLRALVQAQNLLLEEPGTPRVVLAASLLHGLGHAAPPAESLQQAGLDRVSLIQVGELLASLDDHGDAGAADAGQAVGDARLVADAVTIADLTLGLRPGERPVMPPDSAFHTRTAARLARQLLAAVR